MKVEYSSDLLKITFEKNERFEGRKLTIKGEALSCGFDAYQSSMEWLKPYENEVIDEETQIYLVNKILEKEFSTGFIITIKNDQCADIFQLIKLFEQFNDDNKVLLVVLLANTVIQHLSKSEGYKITEDSLTKCLEWLITKDITAYNLYLYLENMDYTSVLHYMSKEKDCEKLKYWNCVSNALAYTIRKAYEFEKAHDFPQTIECVDNKTIEEFILNITKIHDFTLVKDFIDYLIKFTDLPILGRIEKIMNKPIPAYHRKQ